MAQINVTLLTSLAPRSLLRGFLWPDNPSCPAPARQIIVTKRPVLLRVDDVRGDPYEFIYEPTHPVYTAWLTDLDTKRDFLTNRAASSLDKKAAATPKGVPKKKASVAEGPPWRHLVI